MNSNIPRNLTIITIVGGSTASLLSVNMLVGGSMHAQDEKGVLETISRPL
jgi:hypothetical protein